LATEKGHLNMSAIPAAPMPDFVGHLIRSLAVTAGVTAGLAFAAVAAGFAILNALDLWVPL